MGLGHTHTNRHPRSPGYPSMHNKALRQTLRSVS